jgi:hypothetical protein
VGQQGAQVFQRRAQLSEYECIDVAERVVERTRDSGHRDTGARFGTAESRVGRDLALALEIRDSDPHLEHDLRRVGAPFWAAKVIR